MKILEKKCPNCGANLDFKVGERDIVCKSCRRKYAVEYGVGDLSQLSSKAFESLRAADISLRPVRRMMVIAVAIFICFVVIATIISAIFIGISRADFDRKIRSGGSLVQE